MTADLVALYPSIPHNGGLKALKDTLDWMQNKVPTDVLVKVVEFVPSNLWNRYWQQICTILCVHCYG